MRKTLQGIRKIKRRILKNIVLFLVVIFLLGSGVTASILYFKQSNSPAQEDIYTAFLLEVYDKIKDNYWENLTDAQLANYFKSASEQLMGVQYSLESSDKDGLESILDKILKKLPDDKKKEFSVGLVHFALTNLQPLQRSGLYTQKEEKTLQNRVENINPETDLYSTLEIEQNASEEEIKEAYDQKKAELEVQEESPTVKEELKEINYAFGILSDSYQKEKYDSSGSEPTVFSKLVSSDIFHIYIKSMAISTFEEFQVAAATIDGKANPSTLILDLRDNVGGSIDVLPYLLGFFIGNDQYAYEFFQQGTSTPQKTKVGWLPSLVRYKKVVVLINENTQSSAELMASVLKKYNVGVLIGQTTRGWGTIEKVFNIENQIASDETYSIFLVHTLALRDDNQPIEGRGVEPLITMGANWKKDLLDYFNYPELVETVEEIWNQRPGDVY